MKLLSVSTGGSRKRVIFQNFNKIAYKSRDTDFWNFSLRYSKTTCKNTSIQRVSAESEKNDFSSKNCDFCSKISSKIQVFQIPLKLCIDVFSHVVFEYRNEKFQKSVSRDL